jgi:toxin YoeB
MAERNVVWTRTAELQFVGILEFWVERNKSSLYSRKLVEMVAKRTKLIAEKPFLYKSTDFKNTRVASLGNFSLFYKITEEQIIISAFWDNRQDPKKLLEILKDKN